MTARRKGRRDPGWSADEAALLSSLRSPAEIQSFLDAARYSADPIYRSPRSVMRDRRAHCFDGAVFAAAALERLGHPPLLMELSAVRDDDHIIAPYRAGGCWGAVAKSNFVGLRFREPIHRGLRELAISYFDSYFNLSREKTLRGYSVTVSLAGEALGRWRTDDSSMDLIAARLDRARHFPLLSAAQIRGLSTVDERSLQGEMVGADAAGLYDVDAH